jgi:hypothetical protein
LKSKNFLKYLLDFTKNDIDVVNEETLELLQPYLNLLSPNGEEVFVSSVAKRTSPAIEKICIWITAICEHTKNKSASLSELDNAYRNKQ